MKAEEQNKGLVRTVVEQVWNSRHIAKIPDFYSPEYVADYPQFGPPRKGHAALRDWLESLWSAIPDYHEELHELIAEGDFVVVRLTISGTQSGNFMGFPAIGNLKTEEIFILEIREDKIVRQHGLVDLLPVLRARGANPKDS